MDRPSVGRPGGDDNGTGRRPGISDSRRDPDHLGVRNIHVIDRSVPAARRTEFNQWLRNNQGRQPWDIKLPNSITSYRSAQPHRSFERYTDLWDRCRTQPHPKRAFWRQYVGHCPPARVVYRPYYYPYPVYQYWPYRTSSYFYWGYNDYVYDPLYGSHITVVYAPPSTSTYRVERTETYYPSDSSAAGSVEPWPGYRRDRDEAEDAAGDIRDAWLRDDLKPFQSHVDRDLPVRLYEEGEYLYWVQDREFVSRIRDAMEDQGTRKFDIQRVLPVRPGEVMIYARHELRDDGPFGKTQYERYTFELLGSKWMISAYETGGRRLDPD